MLHACLYGLDHKNQTCPESRSQGLSEMDGSRRRYRLGEIARG